MPLTAEQVSRVLRLLRQRYPDWSGFSDPRFEEEEIGYKQAAIEKARELLGEERLRSLIEHAEFDEILRRIEQVGRATNLLFMGVPRHGDLGILYHPLDKGGFCAAVLELLHGEGDGAERLGRYIAYVSEHGLPNRWPFPTYLLFLCHPESEIFIKPRVTKDFLQILAAEGVLQAKPSGESYAAVKRTIGEVREALSQYGPRDMVHMQSMVWVCGREVTSESSRLPLEEFLERNASAERLARRAEAEGRARELLTNRASSLDQTHLLEFLDLIDTDFSEGENKKGRFGLAFEGANRAKLVKNLPALRIGLQRLWNATSEELPEAFNQLTAGNAVPGAARLLPSVVLYLRDPERFACWSGALRRGLEKLTGETLPSKKSFESYIAFCETASRFREAHGVPARALDIVLSSAELIELTEPPPGGAVFTTRTFELLQGLHENPTRDFYSAHKREIKEHLEEPFRMLFLDVAAHLPETIRAHMETDKGVFARIVKNDWGQGGAWDYYWGAFYPKGGKRIEDAQLFLWINRSRLDFGFYIGAYGTATRSRFLRNCKQYSAAVLEDLADVLADDGLSFGQREEQPTARGAGKQRIDGRAWLADPEANGIRVGVCLGKEDVLSLSAEQLRDRITRAFQALFPLVLLASHDDPLPAIAKYLELEPPDVERAPEFDLETFADETSITPEVLMRWVRAVERKGQAIFYGPPGTGKTFAAERLARHLISGGDGFFEVVQFHPAYAYEDFMQGIRPIRGGNGGLDYSLVPGRFLEFCRKARERMDRCVLIVDEINRANLSRVFGELMYLLEYRNAEVPLAAGGVLRIPPNVRLIGTMNTADRSIALVDHALRRRFAFLALSPNYDVLREYHAENGFKIEGLITVLRNVNEEIGDPHYAIGMSFFLRGQLNEHIEEIWRTEIEPYLEEYFFDRQEKVDAFRWDSVRGQILP